MKKQLIILLMLLGASQSLTAQYGIGNHGPLRFHGSGAIGLHADLWNSGIFTSPDGRVGLYHDSRRLRIYGSVSPEWFDLELAAAQGVTLYLPLFVGNNVNFVEGDFLNRQSEPYAALIFQQEAFETGAYARSKVDGYAAFQFKDMFILPLGSSDRYRPLGIESQAVNGLVTGGYFLENPNNIRDLPGRGIGRRNRFIINPEEFWTLEGALPSRLTLSWGNESQLKNLISDLSELRVLGLNPKIQSWEDLGRTSLEGDISAGAIRTDWIIPSNYARIALGIENPADDPAEFENANFYISPNGDGKNETLILPLALENPDNTLSIYNRYGILVFQERYYRGSFMGKSNKSGSLKPNLPLKKGTYFYILTLHETGENHQGFFYLDP